MAMERSEACGSSTDKKRAAIELTQYMVHKHYCENDPEALIALFDEPLAWFGAGENEYASGRDTVSAIFREFAGKVPKCIVSEEEYRAEDVDCHRSRNPCVFAGTSAHYDHFPLEKWHGALLPYPHFQSLFRNGERRCGLPHANGAPDL